MADTVINFPPKYWEMAEQLCKFNIPNLTQKQKERLYFITGFHLFYYDLLDGTLGNSGFTLNKILWTVNKSDIPCSDALGCATGDAVYNTFLDDARFDSFVCSMELFHRILDEYFVKRGDRDSWRKANDYVHWAANYGKPYCFYIPVSWVTQSFFGLIQKVETINIFYYNQDLILRDEEKIKKSLLDGTAPKGFNQYWTEVNDTRGLALKRQVLDWLIHESTPHTH